MALVLWLVASAEALTLQHRTLNGNDTTLAAAPAAPVAATPAAATPASEGNASVAAANSTVSVIDATANASSNISETPTPMKTDDHEDAATPAPAVASTENSTGSFVAGVDAAATTANKTEDATTSSEESSAPMSAADMFNAANRQLNRHTQNAKHAIVEATSKAEEATEMKAAEDKAREDAHAEAARMEAVVPEAQNATPAEATPTDATPTNATEMNATEVNATDAAPANATALTNATASANATPASPKVVQAVVEAPEDIAEEKVKSEEEKFPTDWIKNDVKYNVDKTKSTREDSVAEQVQKQMKWKTSTEGWFLQTKSFTLRPWGTPA